VSIVPVLLFCSLLLVVGSIVLFVWSAKQGDCHEADRLCLLPLEDDTTSSSAGSIDPSPSPSSSSPESR
jgi:hypothetical protein